MYILIYALLWVVIYFIEGCHDVAFIKQLDLSTGWKDKEKVRFYSAAWHILDAVVFGVFHMVTSILFSFFLGIFTFTHIVLLVAISTGIRCTVHDVVISVGRGLGWNYVPSCEGWHDFWDCFIRKMDEIGINQYFIRIPLLVIPFVVYYLIY